MKILAVECSATPCSVAIIEDGKILASSFTNTKLTHSQTLMPMTEAVLKASLTKIDDIEGFAVSVGPGSFTGVRIGISAVKGMAQAKNIPCVSVSTLRAMAENLKCLDCIVCAVMDARCNQVYNALFDIQNGEITRLCDDRALMCDELCEIIKNISNEEKKPVVILGDGTDVFYPFVKDIDNVLISNIKNRFQNAEGVALAAEESFLKGDTVSPQELLPFYLRLPQAERELKLKKGENL